MAKITLPGRGAIDLDAEGAQIDNILMDGQSPYVDETDTGDASQAVNETHFDANSLPLWDSATAYSRGDQVRYNDGTTTQFYELLSATDTGTTPGTDTTVWARHSDTPHFGSISFGSLNVPASEHGATLQINHSNGINFTSSGTPNTIGITYTGTIAQQADVDVTTPPTNGQILEWNGTDWVPGNKSSGIDEVNDGTTTVSITGGEDLQFRHGTTNERTSVGVTNESGNPRVTISTNIPDANATRTGTSTGGILTDGQAATLASAIQETDINSNLAIQNNSNVYTIEYDGTTLGASIDVPGIIDGRITTTAPSGTTIDSSWLPDVNYGVVRSFDAGTSNRDAALALRNAAPSGHDWDLGDVAIISYTDGGVVETESFMYVGSANSVSATTNADWRTISTTPVLENLRQLADTPNSNPTADRQVLVWDQGSDAWTYGTVMGGATGHIGANSITTDELHFESGAVENEDHILVLGDGTTFNTLDPSTLNTNLGYTASTRVLTSSTGTDVTLPEVTTTAPGLSSVADKMKLDGIDDNATAINNLSDIDDVTLSSGIAAGHILHYDLTDPANPMWVNTPFQVAPSDISRGTNPVAVNGQVPVQEGANFQWKTPFTRAYATGTAYNVLENFTHGDDLYIVDTAIAATNTVADPANLPTGTVTRILNGAQTGNEIVSAINAGTTTGNISIGRLDADVAPREHVALWWDTTGTDASNLELPHVVVSGTRTDLPLTTVQNFLEMGGKGWVANRRYFPGDIVLDNGGSGDDWRPYIARTDHESETGRPAADTTNWALMTFSLDNLSDFRGYQDQSGTNLTSLTSALNQDIITVNETSTGVYQWINEDRGTMLTGAINTAHANADISLTRVDGLLASSTTGSGKNVLLSLQDGSVTEARIAEDAVSVEKLDDGSRTPTAGYAVTIDGTDTTEFNYAPLQNKTSSDTGLYGLNYFDDTTSDDFDNLFNNTFFPGGGTEAPGAGEFNIYHHPTDGINGYAITINPNDASSPTAVDFEAVLDRAIARELEIHWVFSIPSEGLHVECQTREGGLRTKYAGLGGTFTPFNGSFAFQFDYIGHNQFTGGYTTSGNFTTTFVEVNHKLIITVDEIQHGPQDRVLSTTDVSGTDTVGWTHVTSPMVQYNVSSPTEGYLLAYSADGSFRLVNPDNFSGGTAPTPAGHPSITASPTVLLVGGGSTVTYTVEVSEGTITSVTNITTSSGTIGAVSGTGRTRTFSVTGIDVTSTGTLTVTAEVAGTHSTGSTYTGQTVTSTVEIENVWYTSVSTSAPTDLTTSTNEGAFTVGDTATVTGAAGAELYVWVPNGRETHVAFNADNASGYPLGFTTSTVTSGDFRRLDFGTLGAGASLTLYVEAV